ncbi:MOSC domain-containing protein YiiM [Peribacillus deserti]|uniref:MOSC domain-containing protein YiiM n=1 Tax=Peribacillus deserti TaxID=673318 RepID=A0ABS2QH47_9BACI|nr:MOSC domain-containing protein [Peribacillus deserti]MBM7692491.1 MOSC domain-containing protein YiiM [Peribacillus deserti]
MNSKNIISLHTGRPQIRKFSDYVMKTAIGKEAQDFAELRVEGFSGDGQANLKHHGGPDRAVCFYPFEHYSYWEKMFEQALSLPAFGENATVSGMLEDDMYIGDVISMGDAVVQICEGRIPCATVSMQNNQPNFLKKLLDTGYTGYFARVLKAGIVEKGSEVVLLERKQETVSVLYANLVMFQDRDGEQGARTVLEAEGLSDEWRNKLQKRIL